ncbi:tol-pal system-associated acyl-CoA thioesterase [Methyloversatilis thermotolerans]|uniref:tol-pal system-associated acyl-CoA thioesterase n=1 Tax=Methyloversatilis thermotolerans TaxID=1346290 RepID=UPI00036D71C7|nr:tol-pal system-associated acyl-CoA thioesterase [Methyloversatilis thermotolerans]
MTSPAQDAPVFRWPVRVYYEDTDSFGVVYYANYLRFLERARTEWLRALGVDQVELAGQGIGFVVRTVQCTYFKPARFNDALEVRSIVRANRRSVLDFEQQVFRGEELLLEGTVGVVCIDAATLRPIAVPAALRERLHPHIQPVRTHS